MVAQYKRRMKENEEEATWNCREGEKDELETASLGPNRDIGRVNVLQWLPKTRPRSPHSPSCHPSLYPPPPRGADWVSRLLG